VSVEILTGDVLGALDLLPDESVHCVVTSPPYWGLRDYGTAQWVGGDPACDHQPTNTTRMPWANAVKGPNAQGKNGATYANMTKETGGVCGVCGAVRVDQQIGLEPTLGEHLETMVRVFREVRRVLRKDGTLWLNYGDCYATSPNGRKAADVVNDDRTFRDKPFSTIGGHLKAKDRALLPARVAIALQESGWWVRDEIIWHKPNPMPISVKDRTTPAHEMLYMFSRSARYHYDQEAIKESVAESSKARLAQSTLQTQMGGPKQDAYESGGTGQPARSRRPAEILKDLVGQETRNRRSVWSVSTKPFAQAHFATFPPDLIRPCILAGCPEGGTVLDPFFGAGTTGLVAHEIGRNCIGIELNPDYVLIAAERIGLDVCGMGVRT
jgi:DNA modification methylase